MNNNDKTIATEQAGLPRALVEEICSSLRSIFGSSFKDAILFGSYARGDFDSESDVDIAVLLDMPREEIKRHRKEVVSLSSKIASRHDKLASFQEIALADFRAYQDASGFYRNIAREGVVLNAG